jgi:hypothetical protein
MIASFYTNAQTDSPGHLRTNDAQPINPDHSCTNGAQPASPGQRPGLTTPREMRALKGRNSSIANQLVGANKMVELGSGSQRKVEDVMLTRYSCYLVAQNGDARELEMRSPVKEKLEAA